MDYRLLHAKTVAQLRALAREEKIKIPAGANKARIVELLLQVENLRAADIAQQQAQHSAEEKIARREQSPAGESAAEPPKRRRGRPPKPKNTQENIGHEQSEPQLLTGAPAAAQGSSATEPVASGQPGGSEKERPASAARSEGTVKSTPEKEQSVEAAPEVSAASGDAEKRTSADRRPASVARSEGTVKSTPEKEQSVEAAPEVSAASGDAEKRASADRRPASAVRPDDAGAPVDKRPVASAEGISAVQLGLPIEGQSVAAETKPSAAPADAAKSASADEPSGASAEQQPVSGRVVWQKKAPDARRRTGAGAANAPTDFCAPETAQESARDPESGEQASRSAARDRAHASAPGAMPDRHAANREEMSRPAASYSGPSTGRKTWETQPKRYAENPADRNISEKSVAGAQPALQADKQNTDVRPKPVLRQSAAEPRSNMPKWQGAGESRAFGETPTSAQAAGDRRGFRREPAEGARAAGGEPGADAWNRAYKARDNAAEPSGRPNGEEGRRAYPFRQEEPRAYEPFRQNRDTERRTVDGGRASWEEGRGAAGDPRRAYANARTGRPADAPQPRYVRREYVRQDPNEVTQAVSDLLAAGDCAGGYGVLEIMPDGYGFLRAENCQPGPKDVYVSAAQIRRFNLRTGDYVVGRTRPQREGDRLTALLFIDTINGDSPEKAVRRPRFDDLTPIYPQQRIRMEAPQGKGDMALRVIDLLSPIGRGQRALIVSQPKAGKTVLLKKIANSITENNPDLSVIVLLIDERPEEVTDMQRSIRGDVVYSTFDEVPENHVKVAEMVLERAQRQVEQGKDVVLLLDSITRLARAYNLVIPPTGRTLSGGLDPGALHKPKRFFGAARNIENGGSLTIIATALVETGSRMDDIIFEEFKGTGNSEIHLDRRLSEKRIFPAIDMNKSGTRRDDLLLTPAEMEGALSVRRMLAGVSNQDTAEQLLSMLEKTASNEEFCQRMKGWFAAMEKDGYVYGGR